MCKLTCGQRNCRCLPDHCYNKMQPHGNIRKTILDIYPRHFRPYKPINTCLYSVLGTRLHTRICALRCHHGQAWWLISLSVVHQTTVSTLAIRLSYKLHFSEGRTCWTELVHSIPRRPSIAPYQVAKATMTVRIPSTMNSHFHPYRPAMPRIWRRPLIRSVR